MRSAGVIWGWILGHIEHLHHHINEPGIFYKDFNEDTIMQVTNYILINLKLNEQTQH